MNTIYEEVRVALHQIWKRRWLALIVAWGVAVAGWLVIALIPNSYESKSRVFVQLQSVLSEEIGITERAQQADFSRIQQTLASAPVLEAIVRRTDLAQRVSTEEEIRRLASKLRDKITVVAEPNNTFEITASWSGGGFSDANSARLARQINQGLLDAFTEQNLAGTRTESTQSIAFLDRQISERQRALQQASQRQAELEAGFQTTLPGSGPLSARIDAARAELRRIESDLVPAQSSLSAVRAQMSGTSPTISLPGTYVPSAGGGGAAAQLNALQAELSQGQARGWTDSHPDVVALQRQIGRARAAAGSEGGGGGGRTVPGGTTANPMFMSLQSLAMERQATVAGLSAQRDSLRRALVEIERRRAENPAALAEQERLSRDTEVLQTQYNQLLGDRERIRLRGDVASATDANQFRVIQPPTSPSVPAAPNRPLLLILVLIAAGAIGVGAAFAKSQLESSYASARRLAGATGLPVIGSISEIVDSAKAALRRRKLVRFAGATAALGGVFALLMLVEFIQRGLVA